MTGSSLKTVTFLFARAIRLVLSALPDETTGYSWTGPNGFSASTREITVSENITANDAGEYVVTYTDPEGCFGTATVLVKVYDLPDATATAQNASCGLDNGSITISFSDNPDFSEIEFSLDGGITYESAVSAGSATVTYDAQATGSYDIYARWGTGECPVFLNSVTIGG